MTEKIGEYEQSDPQREAIRPLAGATPLFACQTDPRFSFCLYVSESARKSDEFPPSLLVTVHGTGRRVLEYRDAFAAFAEAHRCVILAPLFPAGIAHPWEVDSYKLVKDGELRYDEVLLSMIDQAASAVRVDTSRFLLHGFSGGGQFAHRFFYLHPDRLLGVSIGAPGSVTLLDDTRDWWVGVKNLHVQFSVEPDIDTMRHVPVQMAAGSDDTNTRDITIKPGERRWMEGANDAGVTRLDRLASLRGSLERRGITVNHEVVPGVGHDGFKLIKSVQRFFADILNQRNDQTRHS